MVVDHGYLAAFFQNILAFHKAHLICIHHDAQGALGDDGQCVLRVDKVVLLACTAQCIDQAARKGSVTPHRDHRRDIAYFADAQHALGGADGIQIAHAVAHNDYMVGFLDQLYQLVGHDAAAHLAALFHSVAHAAVERKAVRCHFSGLISAAALRHIQCLYGHILSFPQGLGPAANADGQRKVHAGVQRTDLVQHIVAAVCELLHLALFHHSNIAAACHTAQKAAAPADHILQRAVDAFQQAGTLAVQHVTEHIVVAVHQKHQIARTAGFVFRLHLAQGSLLVQHQQGHALRIAGHRGAVYAPHAVREGQQLALLLAALLQIKAGQHLLHAAHQRILPVQQAGAELCIVPQHRLTGKQRGRLRERLQTELQLGAFKTAAAHPPGHPLAQLAAEQHHHNAPQHHQCQQRRPCRGPLDQQQQHQQAAQHGQTGGEHLQCPSWFLFHQISCLPPHCLRQRARIRPPSGWEGSSGCAWCADRYSCSVPRARGS